MVRHSGNKLVQKGKRTHDRKKEQQLTIKSEKSSKMKTDDVDSSEKVESGSQESTITGSNEQIYKRIKRKAKTKIEKGEKVFRDGFPHPKAPPPTGSSEPIRGSFRQKKDGRTFSKELMEEASSGSDLEESVTGETVEFKEQAKMKEITKHKQQLNPKFYDHSVDLVPMSRESTQGQGSVRPNKRTPRPFYYDCRQDAVSESLKESKKMALKPKRVPRPYYYNQEWDGIPASIKEEKSVTISEKRTPRPFYRTSSTDSVPRSLRSEREKVAKYKRRSPRPYYFHHPENKVPRSLRERHERNLRPLYYDEFLDGVAESLLSLSEKKVLKVKENKTVEEEIGTTQSSVFSKEKIANKDAKKAEETSEAESETESQVSKVEKSQSHKVRPTTSSLLSDGSYLRKRVDKEVKKNTSSEAMLSAQKLVKGEAITNFCYNFDVNRTGLKKILNLQHRLLLKQERHISDFCHSEIAEKGKNRSPQIINFNEGAIRLIPTMESDSKYIHASHINLPHGNFIIAQGPTKQSLIDFYRMIWQYQVLLVVCLEPLKDENACYQYFSRKRRQEVKVEGRISFETCEIMETKVPHLFIYEVMVKNMEEKFGANDRRIHILHYDNWTCVDSLSPATLIKLITVMEAMNEKESTKPIVVHGTHGIQRSGIFVVTALLTKQITQTGRISVLKAAMAVRRRRYGVLRSLTEYQLILQSALYYAKQFHLIKNDETFRNALKALEEKGCNFNYT